MICISIAHISQIEEVNALKPDMIELRLDLIKEDSSMIMDRIEAGPKLIATCRPGWISDDDRLTLFKKLIDTGIAFIDIEIDANLPFRQELIEYARDRQTEVIVSWHDFKETSTFAELETIMSSCYDMGADIAKIACMVNTKEDNANLLSLYRKEGRKVILGMGELGKITRLAALKLGAEFTFVSADDQHATAPGQLTLGEYATLNNILKST